LCLSGHQFSRKGADELSRQQVGGARMPDAGVNFHLVHPPDVEQSVGGKFPVPNLPQAMIDSSFKAADFASHTFVIAPL